MPKNTKKFVVRRNSKKNDKTAKFRRNRTHYTHSSVKAFILVAALTNKEGNAQKHQEICSTEKQ